jgi:hypothetical protein
MGTASSSIMMKSTNVTSFESIVAQVLATLRLQGLVLTAVLPYVAAAAYV